MKITQRISMNIVVILFSGIIFSCNTLNNDSNKMDAETNRPSDTLTKDIPLDKKGRPWSYYRNKEMVEDKLGITTIENGFDSLQIRIWYGYAFNESSQLVIIKNIAGEWSGEFYTFKYHLTEKGDSIQHITKTSVSKSPDSGWKTFTEKMLALNILSLPDYHSIPGYLQSTDGDAVIVEISTKKRYRIYSYHEPGMNKEKFQQARSMEQILELIENEFDFKRLRNV